MNVRQLVYATVAYADVFDYPLKASELKKWMIGTSFSAPAGTMPGISRQPYDNTTLITLYGREHLINIRRIREESCREKWDSIRSAAKRLGTIPGVRLVGVTGGLAMNNAAPEDDIDLFFITAPGVMWMTRLLVTLFAELSRIRRRPRETRVAGKICLNMFMDGGDLSLPQTDRDLFAAHEVLQMEPVWKSGETYRKFLDANAWTKPYLPNAWNYRYPGSAEAHAPETFLYALVIGLMRIFEPAAKIVQLWYMQKRRTSEVIGEGIIRFHPVDARVWVRKKFGARLKKANIPLDNIFYHR